MDNLVPRVSHLTWSVTGARALNPSFVVGCCSFYQIRSLHNPVTWYGINDEY